jgi:nitrogen fixation NifU-like protein
MTQPQLESLYQQLIIEHYRQPRNKGELPEKTVEVQMANPVCGDEIRLQLQIEGETIVNARFLGQACAISQAAVSMMTGLLKGRSLADAEDLSDRFKQLMRGDEGAARDRALGNLRALQGVSKFPVRIKCALLAFDALEAAMKESQEETP